jgi:hypothetical protein
MRDDEEPEILREMRGLLHPEKDNGEDAWRGFVQTQHKDAGKDAEILRELRELRRAVERLTDDFRQTKSAFDRVPDNIISAILAFVGIGLAGFIAIWLIRDLGPRAVHWW